MTLYVDKTYRQRDNRPYNFHVHTVHSDNHPSFFHQLMHNWIVLKIFKFKLKLTLKGSYMFRCEKHHHQGAHYLSLAKDTIVKIRGFCTVCVWHWSDSDSVQ